ncbi:MAG: outer membrane beta-barrel protein [Prevotellaceae bacterium]|nr:outer membrane beta-barrel protein [Candidatus Minthosoma caballi]
MKFNLLRFFYTLIISTFVFTAQAQTLLKGKVIDSENGDPLMRSTVMVMSADTAHMVTGGVTSEDGTFNLKNVKDGTYIVKISYIGYHNFFRKVTLDGKKTPTQTIGTVMLVPNSIELKQAVVTAQMKEVEVKEDTIIFNADAFKVPEGSVLEELVRKLPGVTVEDDGTIKVNGKTVTKFLVGGKEFFANDKQIAMKNFPTEIVDKIKTYDRQSDMTRITGIDDGNEETVLDLTLKKGMDRGWIGNASAGYGTKDRHAERLFLRRMASDYNVTAIGSLNNTNDRTGGGGGRGGNNGNTTSGMGGANLVVSVENFELGGSINYNYRKSDTRTINSSQNFVSTNGSYSNSRSQGLNKNNSLGGNFKVEWKPDSLTTILFQPNFSFGKSDNSNNNSSATFNDDPYQGGIKDPLSQMKEISNAIKINENSSSSWSDGSNHNLSASLMVNRRIGGNPWFGEPGQNGYSGRNMSIRLSGTTSGNKNHNTNFSNVIYHQRNDSTDLTYRYRNSPSSNSNYSIGITWNEPIMRNLFAQVNYSFNHSKRHSDGQTFDFAKADEIGQQLWNDYGQYGLLAPNYFEFLSDSLSRYTDNINDTHNTEFSLRYIQGTLNISAGVRMEMQHQKMIYQYQGLDTIASRNISRISPTLNARLRFSRQHTLQFTYRGQSQQPEMTDLFNLTDNSNPLNIREGNPNLKPSFNNNFNINYNNAFIETNQTIFGRFSFGNTINSISNRTEYNPETGGQTTRPENINGNWNIRGEVGFNTPLGWDKLMLNTSSSAAFSNHVSYIYQNRETVKNNVEQTTLGERLSITMRMGYFDVRANGNLTWSKSTSQIVTATNQSTYNFHYGLSSTGNFENGFGYSTDIGVSSRRGYSSAAMNTNEVIWNAQVSYRFLKGRKGTLSLNAYDILHQRSNISRSISATSRRDTETNSINSYLMATFLYRFNSFGNREARQNLRQSRMAGYERPDMGGERGGEGAGPRGGDRGGERGGRGGFGGPGGMGGGRF